MNKDELEWRKQHLKNMIWSAKHPAGLFRKDDISKFEKELKEINSKLKKMRLM